MTVGKAGKETIGDSTITVGRASVVRILPFSGARGLNLPGIQSGSDPAVLIVSVLAAAAADGNSDLNQKMSSMQQQTYAKQQIRNMINQANIAAANAGDAGGTATNPGVDGINPRAFIPGSGPTGPSAQWPTNTSSASLNFNKMDITVLITMVMQEAAKGQPAELQASMQQLQQHVDMSRALRNLSVGTPQPKRVPLVGAQN
jgi:hypothetical protein